jgi:hypothetical protein
MKFELPKDLLTKNIVPCLKGTDVVVKYAGLDSPSRVIVVYASAQLSGGRLFESHNVYNMLIRSQ